MYIFLGIQQKYMNYIHIHIHIHIHTFEHNRAHKIFRVKKIDKGAYN